jgi:hypothetical protein
MVQIHITSNDGVPIYIQIINLVKHLIAPLGRLAQRTDSLFAEAGHFDIALNEVMALVRARHETMQFPSQK